MDVYDGDEFEATEAELAAWTRAALLTVATPSEADRLYHAIRPAADAAYESGLVQGLCREGAVELLQSAAVEEARRLIALGTYSDTAGSR